MPEEFTVPVYGDEFEDGEKMQMYQISTRDSAKMLVQKILRRNHMNLKDPNLFFLTFQVDPINMLASYEHMGRAQYSIFRGNYRKGSCQIGTLYSDATLARTLDLRKDNKLTIHHQPGGTIRIYDNCFSKPPSIRQLMIARTTTCVEVIQLILTIVGSTESTENYCLVEEEPNDKSRRLRDKDYPLLLMRSSGVNGVLILKRAEDYDVDEKLHKRSWLTRSKTPPSKSVRSDEVIVSGTSERRKTLSSSSPNPFNRIPKILKTFNRNKTLDSPRGLQTFPITLNNSDARSSFHSNSVRFNTKDTPFQQQYGTQGRQNPTGEKLPVRFQNGELPTNKLGNYTHNPQPNMNRASSNWSLDPSVKDGLFDRMNVHDVLENTEKSHVRSIHRSESLNSSNEKKSRLSNTSYPVHEKLSTILRGEESTNAQKYHFEHDYQTIPSTSRKPLSNHVPDYKGRSSIAEEIQVSRHSAAHELKLSKLQTMWVQKNQSINAATNLGESVKIEPYQSNSAREYDSPPDAAHSATQNPGIKKVHRKSSPIMFFRLSENEPAYSKTQSIPKVADSRSELKFNVNGPINNTISFGTTNTGVLLKPILHKPSSKSLDLTMGNASIPWHAATHDNQMGSKQPQFTSFNQQATESNRRPETDAKKSVRHVTHFSSRNSTQHHHNNTFPTSRSSYMKSKEGVGHDSRERAQSNPRERYLNASQGQQRELNKPPKSVNPISFGTVKVLVTPKYCISKEEQHCNEHQSQENRATVCTKKLITLSTPLPAKHNMYAKDIQISKRSPATDVKLQTTSFNPYIKRRHTVKTIPVVQRELENDSKDQYDDYSSSISVLKAHILKPTPETKSNLGNSGKTSRSLVDLCPSTTYPSLYDILHHCNITRILLDPNIPSTDEWLGLRLCLTKFPLDDIQRASHLQKLNETMMEDSGVSQSSLNQSMYLKKSPISSKPTTEAPDVITIKSIKPNTPASFAGNFSPGMLLLEINGEHLLQACSTRPWNSISQKLLRIAEDRLRSVYLLSKSGWISPLRITVAQYHNKFGMENKIAKWERLSWTNVTDTPKKSFSGNMPGQKLPYSLQTNQLDRNKRKNIPKPSERHSQENGNLSEATTDSGRYYADPESLKEQMVWFPT